MVVAVDTALCQSHHSTDMTLRNRSKGANMGCEGNSHPRSKLHANGVASRSLGKENGFSKHRVVKEATSRNDVFTEAVAAKQESHKTKSQNGEAAGADRRTGFHFRFPSLDLSVSVNRPWNNKRVVFHIGMALLAILFMEHVFLTYPSRCIAACTIAAGHWVVEVDAENRTSRRVEEGLQRNLVCDMLAYTGVPLPAYGGASCAIRAWIRRPRCLFHWTAIWPAQGLWQQEPGGITWLLLCILSARSSPPTGTPYSPTVHVGMAAGVTNSSVPQIYYGSSLSLMEAWPVVAAASVGGLLAETFNGPLGLDDNFLIPCSSAAMATAVMFLRGS
eukprot:scaffold420_cov404-Prasinococcus_capsulatus_cf.AAC.20